MASGYPVATINTISGTPTQFAQPSAVYDGGVTGALTPVIDFQGSGADEYILLGCRLSEDYAGGGIKLRVRWISTGTSGSVRWVGSIRSTDVGDSLTTTFTWSTNEQAVVTATSGTAGTEVESVIVFADGAQMNSIVAGKAFTLRLHRNPGHASDTLTDIDARLVVQSLAILE